MNKQSRNICITFLISSLLLFSCAPSAENKLNKGIEQINKGETEKGIANIEEGLISYASLKKINSTNLLYGINLLYFRQKKTYNFIWPIETEIASGDNCSIISYNPGTNKIGMSDGFDIKLYDSEGNFIKTLGPVKDENPGVKAFININDKVYYYKDKRIYIYDLLTDNEEFLTNEHFLKPFTEDKFNVKFYNTDNTLALILGIAGRYNLNIIDLSGNSVILKNVKAASPVIAFKENSAYYISGDAGKYYLNKADLKSRKTEKKINFESLIDIEFFNSGFIYEGKDGIWVSSFDGNNRQKIPFNYKLAGVCGNNPVFKYNEFYFVMDMDKLHDQLGILKDAVPMVFGD